MDNNPATSFRGIIDVLAADVGYEAIVWAAMPSVAYVDAAAVDRLCTTAAAIAANDLAASVYDSAADHFRDVIAAAPSADDIDGEARALIDMLDSREQRQDAAANYRDQLRRVLADLAHNDATRLVTVDEGQPTPEPTDATDTAGAATADTSGPTSRA